MRLSFLTARWVNLVNLSYAVPRELLQPLLPPGLTFDERDGQTFVSLVAFDFVDTRVLGIPWLGFRHFAELNLRFYVRHGAERGVVFIREYVPQALVAWVARTIYNEPYVAAPLISTPYETADSITVDYRLTWAGRTHRITATGSKSTKRPPDSSVEHFFKEHHWGFGVSRRGQTIRYEVQHPVWDIYPLQSYTLDFNFGQVYGPQWAFLAQATPYAVALAVGSPIAVYPHGGLRPM